MLTKNLVPLGAVEDEQERRKGGAWDGWSGMWDVRLRSRDSGTRRWRLPCDREMDSGTNTPEAG